MKNLFKGYFSILLSLLICFSSFIIFSPLVKAENTNNSYETDEIKYVEINLEFSGEETSKENRTKLQNAFNEARDYATPFVQYKIILPENITIKISGNIGVYSNTYFDLNGSTIVRDYSTSNVMFKAGREIPAYGYEGYGNITITNGTIDGWDNEQAPSTSPLMRWGHSQNILFENLNFVDNCNTHYVEMAACKDFTIRNCTFRDQHLVNGETSPSEVIQIDALQPDGFPLYDYYDGTSCNNINIDNCTFDNVTRGIGSHAVILGDNNYYKNINITNCTFNKVSNYCVVSLCWIDTIIQNNVMTDCGSGIIIRSMRSDYSRMFDGEFTNPIEDYNTLIENNTIDANQNAIRLTGFDLPEKKEWYSGTELGGTIPAGDYVLSNIRILNNNITCKDTAVYVLHTKASEISGNTVNVNTTNSSKVGIYLSQNSYNNIVSGNTVKNIGKTVIKAGILLSGSQKNNIVNGNSVNGKITNGIFIYSGSNNTKITENSVINSESAGIYVHSSKSVTVNSNNVTLENGNGISLVSKSSTPSIQNNTITLSDQYSCINVNNSSVTSISENAISKGKNGIYSKDGTIGTISENKTDGSKYGINLDNSKTIISDNKLTNSKAYGILTESNAEATIYTNTFSKNTKGNIILKGSKDVVCSNLGEPKNFTNKVTAYNKTTLSWKKAGSAVYHRVYRSTDNKKFQFKGAAKENTNTYTDQNLTPGKSYSYQITPVIHNGQTYVIGKNSKKNESTTGVIDSSLEALTQNKTIQVLISWDNNFIPEKYQIYRRESNEKKYSLLRTVDGKYSACYDTTVLPNKTYYYMVRQICHGENNKTFLGKVSNIKSVKTKVFTGDIVNLKRKNKNQVYISVNKYLRNSGYRIYCSKKKNKGYKLIRNVFPGKSNSALLNLKKGKKYYIKIRAYKKINNKIYYGDYSKIKKI